MVSEFWRTTPDQTEAASVVEANSPSLNNPNDTEINLPNFSDDWMIKFYEKY